jgi:hypothetical protein
MSAINQLHIFGKAPVTDLIALNIVPEILRDKIETMEFSTSIFQTRTSDGARNMAEVFGFDAEKPETYLVDLANIDMNTKEMMLDLPEILRFSGEEGDLEIFNRLRKIPGLTAVIEWG